MTDLLSCPFCGGSADGPTNVTDYYTAWRARCDTCDYEMTRPGRTEVTVAWNRRPIGHTPIPPSTLPYNPQVTTRWITVIATAPPARKET